MLSLAVLSARVDNSQVHISAGARPTEPPPENFAQGPLYSQAKWKVKMVLHRMQFLFDFAFHAYLYNF